MSSTTPSKFFSSCRSGNVDALAKLLDKGVDANSRDNYQLTGLIYAGRKGQVEVGKLLVERGADIDAQDLTSQTALIHGVAFAKYEFVEWIAGTGADVNVIDMHDCTALDHARSYRDRRMEGVLKRFGAIANDSEEFDDSVTEILIAIDELNWFGVSTKSIVMPLRELCDKHCREKYCEEYKSISFVLYIQSDGPENRCSRVGLGKRASYIGIDIIIDGNQDNLPGVIAEQLRVAVDKIVAKMDRTDVEFKSDAFTRDMTKAIDAYAKRYADA